MSEDQIFFFINLTSGGFAVMAAMFWGFSARVKLPQEFPSTLANPAGGLVELASAVAKSSRLSNKAAAYAAVAAFFQVLAIGRPMISALLADLGITL